MGDPSGQAPAKINLTLRVGGLRPDGYHEVESLVLRVDLCDRLQVQRSADGQITLECSDPSLPDDAGNLVVQAALRLREAGGTRAGARIRLDKQIPAASGLGGGSSDAACTLVLLNALWGLGLPGAELERIGARIGSDVPLFFHAPLCIVRGRGAQIEDLSLRVEGHIVLILPNMRSSTPAVYAAWDRLARDPLPPRPAATDILRVGQDAASAPGGPAAGATLRLTRIAAHLYNDLEPAAFAVNPQLARLFRTVTQLAGAPVRLTGSGAGMYALFDTREQAEEVAARLRRDIHPRLITRVVGPESPAGARAL